MLTRLRVDGFKNLVDIDIRFGPFTCIAGANGVGKSNVFDAIAFLAALADRTFVEAASSIRSDGDEGGELSDLFFRSGGSTRETIRFECDLVIPAQGEDDLGQPAVATSTFLRYRLELGRSQSVELGGVNFELLEEELVHVNKTEARSSFLPFVGAAGGEWFESVFVGGRTESFISTVHDANERKVRLHQDGRSSTGRKEKRRGRSIDFLAERLPRTVLSSTSAVESPTALLVRKELRGWRRLQLEGSALRRSDRFDAPDEIGADGSHLPKTLHRLGERQATGGALAPDVFADLAARLTELLDSTRDIGIDVDEVRRRLTLYATTSDGVRHPARSLSDGTLRFLALAILEQGGQPELICLEEPENGIHPSRIVAILQLLLDIAVDPGYPVGPDNPLRQVIVNTHSPGFVRACPKDSLIVADTAEQLDSVTRERVTTARFRALPKTWRHRLEPMAQPVFLQQLLGYLEYTPVAAETAPEDAVGDFVSKQFSLGID